MRRKNKKLTIILLLILVVGIGFAMISVDLNITGYLEREGVSFDVRIVSVEASADNNYTSTLEVNDDLTEITFDSKLRLPGEHFKFYVTVENTGTLLAVLDSVELDENSNQYLDYIIKYKNFDKEPSKLESIGQGFQITYLVDIIYKEDITELPENGVNVNSSITFNYIAAGTDTYSVSDEQTVAGYVYNQNNYEQTFVVPETGRYKLEAWGAQGGNLTSAGTPFGSRDIYTLTGGYGGYSTGEVELQKGDILYIHVGGKGSLHNMSEGISQGGYNGGGTARDYESASYHNVASGGGATHIALTGGELEYLDEKIDKILLVAGGGSGAWFFSDNYLTTSVGHGGGYIGGSGSIYDLDQADPNVVEPGGTQDYTTCSFGKGYDYGGGGFCGGTSGGGSGYIANPRIENGEMVCYDCPTSTEPSTKTTKIQQFSETPVSRKAKAGDGYVVISFLG